MILSYFIILGTLPNVSIAGTTSTDTSITVNIGTLPSGIARDIIGYHRLDLGVPVIGEHVNNRMRSSITFSSLVPGAKYRITVWGLGGGDDRRSSQSPDTREVTTIEHSELMGTRTSIHMYILCSNQLNYNLYIFRCYVCCEQIHLHQETSLILECLMMGLN